MWWITRRLEHDLTEADAAIGAALSQAPTHEFRLPVLGDEIERGIPAFVAQSRAAAALAATSRAGTNEEPAAPACSAHDRLAGDGRDFRIGAGGQNFESSLTTQALEVGREIGRAVIEVIQTALDHDVPVERLVAADRYLVTVQRDNPRVEYLLITGADGRMRYSTDLGKVDDVPLLQRSLAAITGESAARVGKYFVTSTPIRHKDRTIGFLHLGQRANIVEQLMWDIAFDILTVLVVASLVAFELVRLLLAASFSTPLQAVNDYLAGVSAGDFRRYLPRDLFGGIGRLNRRFNAIAAELNSRARDSARAGRHLPDGLLFDSGDERRTLRVNAIDNIRWPFFLMIFAESLSLSFFPIFVAQFYDPSYGLPLHVMIGMPITVFMLVWAIAMPFAGTWCDRVGYRQAFGVGAATTTVGLILTAYATTMVDLLLWRSLTAVGYGIVCVTTQAYITVNVPPSQRTRGQAMFLASFRGSLSGAAIGGSRRPAGLRNDLPAVGCSAPRRRCSSCASWHTTQARRSSRSGWRWRISNCCCSTSNSPRSHFSRRSPPKSRWPDSCIIRCRFISKASATANRSPGA